MGWEKTGLIFRPDIQKWWMKSHCQLPVAMHVKEDIYRIYFASRDNRQYSHVGYVELNIHNPSKILSVSQEPVLMPGMIGCFDEHGVFPSSIVDVGGIIYMYYIGWNKGHVPPLFYAGIGLAVSTDGGKIFHKHSPAPIMSRSEFDTTLVTSPHVYIENNVWKMTYVSGIKWEQKNEKLISYYHIKYAESDNGINWRKEGVIAVDFQNENETNIARSCVIKEDGIYKMWYCYVLPPNLYRIGYAESTNGKHFVRKDHLSELDVTSNSFDSEMMCYPNLFIHKGKKYLLYNGNHYGAEGFGMAIYK